MTRRDLYSLAAITGFIITICQLAELLVGRGG